MVRKRRGGGENRRITCFSSGEIDEVPKGTKGKRSKAEQVFRCLLKVV